MLKIPNIDSNDNLKIIMEVLEKKEERYCESNKIQTSNEWKLDKDITVNNLIISMNPNFNEDIRKIMLLLDDKE